MTNKRNKAFGTLEEITYALESDLKAQTAKVEDLLDMLDKKKIVWTADEREVLNAAADAFEVGVSF